MPKSSERVEAYGDVDELSSILGALAAAFRGADRGLIREIQKIQSDLLHVGAWIATMPGSPSMAFLQEISETHIHALEKAIDRIEEGLTPLRGFILPGGHVSAAWAHIARTVCRRAERKVVHLSMTSSEGENFDQLKRVIVYLNRLSDYLFVVARHCNLIQSVPDKLWKE